MELDMGLGIGMGIAIGIGMGLWRKFGGCIYGHSNVLHSQPHFNPHPQQHTQLQSDHYPHPIANPSSPHHYPHFSLQSHALPQPPATFLAPLEQWIFLDGSLGPAQPVPIKKCFSKSTARAGPKKNFNLNPAQHSPKNYFLIQARPGNTFLSPGAVRPEIKI